MNVNDIMVVLPEGDNTPAALSGRITAVFGGAVTWLVCCDTGRSEFGSLKHTHITVTGKTFSVVPRGTMGGDARFDKVIV